jgi:aspartyl-tRNA(Asn)/glutamyl-tRNA(Gln) amidotransferase subunit A
MNGILNKTVSELSGLLSRRELASSEITRAYLAQIDKKEPEIDAFLAVCADKALATAEETDKKRASGESLPPLAGIPVGLKDNICTSGVKTTCASKMLENFVPPYDADVAERLACCPLLGKLNMDEFAMGSSTENSAVKVTRNPRDTSRVPGGSSGGSAAAVAAGEVPFALGSDTGGSIRQPSAFCGVVGIKPTYGSVSRYGLVAFASSLDQIGPITGTVRDNALVLNAISGHDVRDATSLSAPRPDYTALLGKDVAGMKIALPKEFYGPGIGKEVKESVQNAAKRFERLGAIIDYVSIPTFDYALAAYYVISSAEASSNLARFDGIRFGRAASEFSGIDELYENSRSEGFGDEVKCRIMLGTFALSSGYYDAYYKKAQKVRSLIMRDFSRVFENWDLILSPTAPTTAYRIGEKITNPLEMYAGDICTVPVSIAGLPAMSVPCGTDSNGLPVGMQLVGKAFAEPQIYRAAYAFEQDVKGGKANV